MQWWNHSFDNDDFCAINLRFINFIHLFFVLEIHYMGSFSRARNAFKNAISRCCGCSHVMRNASWNPWSSDKLSTSFHTHLVAQSDLYQHETRDFIQTLPKVKTEIPVLQDLLIDRFDTPTRGFAPSIFFFFRDRPAWRWHREVPRSSTLPFFFPVSSSWELRCSSFQVTVTQLVKMKLVRCAFSYPRILRHVFFFFPLKQAAISSSNSGRKFNY